MMNMEYHIFNMRPSKILFSAEKSSPVTVEVKRQDPVLENLGDVAHQLQQPHLTCSWAEAQSVWKKMLINQAEEVQLAVLSRWIGAILKSNFRDTFIAELKLEDWRGVGYGERVLDHVIKWAQIEPVDSLIKGPNDFERASEEQKKHFLKQYWKEEGWTQWDENWRHVFTKNPCVWEWLWESNQQNWMSGHGFCDWSSQVAEDWLVKKFTIGVDNPLHGLFFTNLLESDCVNWPNKIKEIWSNDDPLREEWLLKINCPEIALWAIKKEMMREEDSAILVRVLSMWLMRASLKGVGPGLFVPSQWCEPYLTQSHDLETLKLSVLWLRWVGLSESKYQHMGIFLNPHFSSTLKKVLEHWANHRDRLVDDWMDQKAETISLGRWLDWFVLTRFDDQVHGGYVFEKEHPRQDRRLVLDQVVPTIKEWQAWAKTIKIKLHLRQAWNEEEAEDVVMSEIVYKRRL